ncbi:dTDP-4-amino-4,6-dideoxygalactose transaminase [Treponema rectale]|uniref:dTDP-4-amino-4,6-dideoxygalactose transaminase n=1 Tax=Treponema rectale TaxID=744512 RepID=A0A840S9P4_9SPIR|nr:dTDP-4-amino-4,6-dideoxygalactose transaminase [Treponema rectale]MBB5218417.1 dTDP-4-amino-4,6-dideoxygalactose transaminase [Treponema rectale]QOS39891.1 dTDP-4-amino-4,6-dideoxygalactose transaminase [Treponema rectale]
MIPFNIPPVTGNEITYLKEAIENKKICGDGPFTKKCHAWLENKLGGSSKVLLTTSGTTALEMAALLCNIQAGDEVIMPSFTFCSTADAFVQRGAKIVFVDIRPDTMNIDENKIERAITPKTKAICAVHYAGVACEMDTIMTIARKHNLKVVEDAAQAICSEYKGRALGTIGDYGCLSFHETKNFSMGEGGAVIINTGNEDYERAEVIREKGTDRSKFLRGQIDKYTWRDYGSSYLPSDLNAAYLFAQLEQAEKIQMHRMNCWNTYYNSLKELEVSKKIVLPTVPAGCLHNAHMFYILTKNIEERTELISFLKENGVGSAFHYIPLHSAPAGIKFGRFDGKDEITTAYSERLVRLPMYYGLSDVDIQKVIKNVKDFYLK